MAAAVSRGPFQDPSRDAFWLRLTPEQHERLIAEDEIRVRRARKNLPAFFEYTMREQTSRVPVQCLPHQHVILDFIQHHDRCQLVLPVGHTKTFCSAATTLFLLGDDPTRRGAIISATQEQAHKTVSVVADYIQTSPQLRRVFPRLRKSLRARDPWTQTAITVDRPPGIPDPSLVAVGFEGAILGARLNWVVIDDLLSFENTYTEEQRKKVYQWVDSSILSRLDPVGAKVVVCNTPWHPRDLVGELERLGWATLRMSVDGDIEISDDATWMRKGRKPWDHRGLRPATSRPDETAYRLRAHDPDPDNAIPLWPEKFTAEHIEDLRTSHLPGAFARMYRCKTRDDETSFCKQEYIELCLRLAREQGHHHLLQRYEGQNPTFTGVDLAFGIGKEHDLTSFFTFEVLEDGVRKLIDVESGQWPGAEMMRKLLDKQQRYNSVVRIESNGAQILARDFALDIDRSIPIKAHTTTATGKAHPQFGVAGLFLEMSNGAWLIPNDRHGRVHKDVERFILECLHYVPTRHTADVLMAAFMAREQARLWGMLAPKKQRLGGQSGGGGSIQMDLTSR